MAKALLEWETLDADQIERHHGRQAAASAQAAGGRAPRRARPPTGRRAPPARRSFPVVERLTGQPIGVLRCGGFLLPLDRPLIMGVVNVTPDSFSDGGQFLDAAGGHRACAASLIDEGADILDIGGESTRPGAQAVAEGEELRRVLPVLKALRECSRLGRYAQARSDARGARGGRVDDQRHRRAARARRAGRGGRHRLRGVPDAHAGRPGDHAGRAELRGRGG